MCVFPAHSATILCGIFLRPFSLKFLSDIPICRFNMDGLRNLAKSASPDFPLEFSAPDDAGGYKFAPATIELVPSGTGAGGGGPACPAVDFQRLSLRQDGLRNFYGDNNSHTGNTGLRPSSGKGPPREPPAVHTLKIVSIPRLLRDARAPNVLNVDRLIFLQVLRDMGVDPWMEHLIRSQAYGFRHSGSPYRSSVDDGDEGGALASYFLG